ncbi:hypothetical protein D1AOALGA4SA_12615 [Olavius algarvensis Delta 1 endosymbiont]|nr:hypothetical protein D1AOALGA4SA_12615 [Olavius algarvensis Delta 1 endosymbiont]
MAISLVVIAGCVLRVAGSGLKRPVFGVRLSAFGNGQV